MAHMFLGRSAQLSTVCEPALVMRLDLCQGAAALVDSAAPVPARDFRQIRSGGRPLPQNTPISVRPGSETIVGGGGARARGLFISAWSL
jgi:hypothetical protein